MGYLDSLNDGQNEAVTTTEGPVRVIAGAGTGKTRALIARYCYLTDMLGIDPAAILCVTFTNKAAAEMKARVRKALGDCDTGYICTFHSFCVRLLKEDIHVLNYPAQFVIADDDDRVAILQKVYEDMGLTLKEQPIKRSVAYIEKRKSNPDYIEFILQTNNEELLQKSIRNADRDDEIFQRYIYEQKKSYACDFDDIINFALYILRHRPEILAKWQKRLEYIMVDEFQDVSPTQYELVQLLAGGHRNLFIVGDPDQTIYSWRGADVGIFLNFDRDFPGTRTIVLDQNYRSTPQIIEPSNALISHNSQRYPKRLVAESRSGLRPVFFHARSEKEEASWIARQIKTLLKSGVALSDVAILYRAHHLSRPLEEVFLKESIPYKIFSGVAFYARREVKDVIAYLRMLVTADDLSFRRTVNTPSRRIGKQKMGIIANEAARQNCSMFEALQTCVDLPAFGGTGAAEYLEAIRKGRELVGKIPLGDLLQRMLDFTGYEAMLRGLSEWERLDNLAELKRAVEETGRDDDATLEGFLDRVALIQNIDRTDERDAVTLMTIHSAKGMEFPVVFICGFSEGSIPSRRSANPDDIEEERRLAYVAVTRARRLLYMSDAEGYNHDNTARLVSRFIYEMDEPNIDFVRPIPPQTPVVESRQPVGETAPFASGDLVDHPIFGRGMVMEVNVQERNMTVQFDAVATPRKLRFSAPLSRINSDKW